MEHPKHSQPAAAAHAVPLELQKAEHCSSDFAALDASFLPGPKATGKAAHIEVFLMGNLHSLHTGFRKCVREKLKNNL